MEAQKQIKTKSQKGVASEHATGYDAIIHVSSLIYNLINSGNIIPLVLILGLFFIGFVSWKVPEEVLGESLGKIIGLFSRDRLYLFLLGCGTAGSLYGNFIQRKVYKNEIKRLTDERSFLMHGIKKGSLHRLKNHNPSSFEIED